MIIDANRLGKFLADPPDEDTLPIRNWLHRRVGAGMLVYSTGEDFESELGAKARTRLADYARAGRARFVPADRFKKDQDKLRASDQLRSDDPHVLALARASGARLLYTGDDNLKADFKNHHLIRSPRGKIYSGAANADLLTSSACAM